MVEAIKKQKEAEQNSKRKNDNNKFWGNVFSQFNEMHDKSNQREWKSALDDQNNKNGILKSQAKKKPETESSSESEETNAAANKKNQAPVVAAKVRKEYVPGDDLNSSDSDVKEKDRENYVKKRQAEIDLAKKLRNSIKSKFVTDQEFEELKKKDKNVGLRTLAGGAPKKKPTDDD